MAGRNNTGLPQAPPKTIIQHGPNLGNVELADSYLRIKQNFDAVYESLQNVLVVAKSQAFTPNQLDVIQKNLQATGTHPLNLTGLIPLNDINAVQFVGTHAQRITKQASTYSVGTLWFETDRTTLYTVLQLSGTSRWVWEGGVYSSAIANRPSDLGPFDAGFLFYATDTYVTYRWSGTTWVLKGDVGVMFADTHTNRSTFTPANYPIGAEYFETDRTVIYRNNGSAWVYIGGQMRNTFANRPIDLGTPDAGFAFYATDTHANYYWDGSSWVLVPSVTSLNTLSGDLTLVAGTGITITPGANNLTFTANGSNGAGVASLNLLTGNINIVAGTNVTLGVGNNNIIINAAGGNNGSGVTSVNTLTGVIGIISANAAELQLSTGNNNITLGAADSWNNATVALAASNDASPSPSTAACRWVRRGKTILFQIYWTGTIASNSQEFKFAVPANFNTTLTYQTVAVWVTGFANNSAILPSACALVPGSPNLIFIRGTTNYLASANAYTIIIGGSYEGA